MVAREEGNQEEWVHGGIRSAGVGKFGQTLLGPALSLLIESTDSSDKRTDNWLLKTF